jgi:ABC-type multidrug transport system fused ATPase/permease subunit
VLDKGELKESGTHDELMLIDDGYYKRLVEMQMTG